MSSATPEFLFVRPGDYVAIKKENCEDTEEKNENYWVGQVIDCIGGARNPNSWTLFQVAILTWRNHYNQRRYCRKNFETFWKLILIKQTSYSITETKGEMNVLKEIIPVPSRQVHILDS